HAGLERTVLARQPCRGIRRKLAGVAARPLSGERAGHCGECHTPRGIAGEMELSRALTGFALSRVAAPDITPAALASRGWTPAGLHASLGRGLARQGSAFGDMHPVIMLSTRNLTAEDLDAVAIYLLGDNPPSPAPPAGATESAAASAAGRMSYVALCAGCH